MCGYGTSRRTRLHLGKLPDFRGRLVKIRHLASILPTAVLTLFFRTAVFQRSLMGVFLQQCGIHENSQIRPGVFLRYGAFQTNSHDVHGAIVRCPAGTTLLPYCSERRLLERQSGGTRWISPTSPARLTVRLTEAGIRGQLTRNRNLPSYEPSWFPAYLMCRP